MRASVPGACAPGYVLSPLRGFFAAALLAAWSLAALPLAGEEPPGAWFLNAHGTGSDYVYFSVGGDAITPPQGTREVLLGWSWNEAGTPVEPYPGAVPARYRPSRLSGKQPWQWVADARRIGAPRLGIGPGRELLLLGEDADSTARAIRWAEMLDSIEAAYRHSSPDLTSGERRGVLEVGRIGHCAIRSVPVEDNHQGWSSLQLAGHARPSRSGGFYYVDRRFDAARERRRTVEIQRFLRFLDGPDDCGGPGLDLSLFPAPREEDFHPPYFMVWSDHQLRPLDFVDLEPTPRAPAVRTLSRFPGTQREEINIATWPAPGARGIDLCRAPFMETLCLKDLRIREQLATSTTSDPAISGPLVDGCRRFFEQQGFDLGSAASTHPCTDPGAWRQSIGPYRIGYTGELVLREQPRLASRLSPTGDVQWLWSGAPDSDRETHFPLADGTQIALGMPRVAPPTYATQPPPSRVSVPRPTTATARRPSSTAPIHQTPDPTPAGIEARPSGIELPAASSPAPVATATGPGRAQTQAAGSEPRGRPAGAPTAHRDSPPGATSIPGSTFNPAGDPTEPRVSASDPSMAGASTNNPVAQQPQPLPTASTEPSAIGTVAPISALSQRLLWPIALALLAMTVFVALLLRGQRVSARARRRALASGLTVEEPAPYLFLEAEPNGERLLAGRALPEASADVLLLEPPSDVDPSTESETSAETDLESDTSPEEPESTGELQQLAEEPEPYAHESEPPTTLEPPSVTPISSSEPVTAPAVLLLEPPRLSETLAAEAVAPKARERNAGWSRLTQEWNALEIRQRQGVDRSLEAVSRLGEWVSCLLPVLDDIEHGRGNLQPLDRLPAPARQEWRECHRILREFADFDLVACHRLRLQLSSSSPDIARDDASVEVQCLSDSGLLDPGRGALPERLRRHLLEPCNGRLQGLVLSLQYLIEALPVEHMEKTERQAYLSAIRRRLQEKGLSTKFHQLVDDLSSGLGLRYRQTRYYKVRLDDLGYDTLRDTHDTIDLSQRIGYTAGTEDNVIVRLSELFLSDSASQERYSGQALIDRRS